MVAIALAVRWLGRLIWRMDTSTIAWLALAFIMFWEAILQVLDALVAWVIAPVMVFVFQRVLDVLFWFLQVLLRLLPLAPDNPFGDLSGMVSQFGWLNRYIPLTEMLNYFAFLVLVISSMTVYKIVKLFRGGG